MHTMRGFPRPAAGAAKAAIGLLAVAGLALHGWAQQAPARGLQTNAGAAAASVAKPLTFISITPCRLMDTRAAEGMTGRSDLRAGCPDCPHHPNSQFQVRCSGSRGVLDEHRRDPACQRDLRVADCLARRHGLAGDGGSQRCARRHRGQFGHCAGRRRRRNSGARHGRNRPDHRHLRLFRSQQAVSFQGVWSGGATYATGNAVFFSGSSYVSLIDSNLNMRPDINPSAWGTLARKGQSAPLG